LTGAEDALVVNNCAGAVLLMLAALGGGREAIVSRGELVEIGGGFRIPDVMVQSGVRLREVGTTNKTRISDYEAALGPDTALLVKVHRSNFAVIGFTEEVATADLAALARARGVLCVEDLGSGCLTEGLGERTVRAAIRDGAEVVTFSGDKLCGGPQAGLVVGTRAAIAKLAAHPLARALRIDKCTAAALEATLRLHRDGQTEAVPALRALTEPVASVMERAKRLAAELSKAGVEAQVVASSARVGGGSLPLRELASGAVALRGSSAELLAGALRAGTPPVIARVQEQALLLDLRAVSEVEIGSLAGAVAAALRDLGSLGGAKGAADA
jgi:L-seryl-tRNA(Ser) seleniumtransferase